MADRQTVHRYCPEQPLGWGPRIWKEMAAELWASRELVWQLFLRDFKGRYKQTALGFFWLILQPLVLVGLFLLLHRAGVFNIGAVNIPYPAYALLGLAIWDIFAKGLQVSGNAIVAGRSMVMKINFPKEALVLASFGQALAAVSIQLLLTGVVFACYGVTPAWTALFLPLALLPLLLFTIGLGLITSMLNALLRDVAPAITLLTTVLLLITPVVYPQPRAGFFRTFAAYNPLAVLVSAPRDLVVNGALAQPQAFAVMSALSLVLVFVGWRIFHLAEPLIAERIGSR